jgi:hypothetical protein
MCNECVTPRAEPVRAIQPVDKADRDVTPRLISGS